MEVPRKQFAAQDSLLIGPWKAPDLLKDAPLTTAGSLSCEVLGSLEVACFCCRKLRKKDQPCTQRPYCQTAMKVGDRVAI